MDIDGAITVNGRTRYFNRIRRLTRTSKGRYAVATTIGDFTIEGGRSLGGSRRDWFLECAAWTKPIDCTSLMDALRCIDTM